MEISWSLFKRYELWLVFIAFMVAGFFINREYDRDDGTVEMKLKGRGVLPTSLPHRNSPESV